MLADLNYTRETLQGRKFFRGAGCDVCNNTGYKGRVGLFELLVVTDEIREMIMANRSADELRAAAKRNGMIPLREYGINFIHEGVTTYDEILRETVVE